MKPLSATRPIAARAANLPPPASPGGDGAARANGERHSLVAVFELVRSGRAVTRSDIERLSGLGRAVVTDRLATLTELGLLQEGALGPAIGGRAPRQVEFRADAGRILVATLDHAAIGVGLADLAGRLRVEHHEPADLSQGPEPTLRRLDRLFEWVLDQYQDGGAVWGIGIGVPHSVSDPRRAPLAPQPLQFAPNWQQELVIETLVARHRAPVWVRSLVQLMTVGELGAGSQLAAGERDLLFVELGEEITAGLVSDGRLHRGAQGMAGRVGHIFAGDPAAICRCGNTGCLEALAGGRAIAREGLRAAQDDRSRPLAEMLQTSGQITVTDIGFAAQAGDPFSADLLSRSGRLIGTTLAMLTNAFNPATIVLGGEVARTGDILLAAIREAVYRHSDPLVTRDLRIVRSQMGNSSGLVGAGLLAVGELFSPEMLGGWISAGSPLRHPEIVRLLHGADDSMRRSAERPVPPGATQAPRSPAP